MINLNVFPIRANSKFPPLVKNWQEQAKPRDQWPDVYGACNYGVHCAGMVVVDVDVRSGGLKSFDDLDCIVGWPETRLVQTPTGGLHAYYSLPDGHPGVMNSASKIAPGIDIKSTGGYVVAAGSKTEAGEYAVYVDAPIAPAPKWLLDKLDTYVPRERKTDVNVPDAHPEIVIRAAEWLKTRPVGDEAYATSCGLRDIGVSATQAFALLADHDGRDPDHLWSKVEHAYLYAKGDAGSKVATIEDFEEGAPLPPKAKTPLPYADYDSMGSDTRDRPKYLVKGILNKKSYALMYGAPGAGKTYCAFELAHSVAGGTDFLGRKTRQGTVLYLAYEGYGGIPNRVRALRLHHRSSKLPIYFHSATFNLREESGSNGVIALAKAIPEVPSLIIIDTLAYALSGGDENSAKDVGAFNAQVQRIIAETGACVLVIHHSGKNADNGARGSSALLGAVDTEILIDSNQIQPTKQRDMELGAPIGFALHSVQVDLDEDDEIITSCVVKQAAVEPKKKGLNGRAKIAWDILLTMPIMVLHTDFREACMAKYDKKEGGHIASWGKTEGLGPLVTLGMIERQGDWIERKQP